MPKLSAKTIASGANKAIQNSGVAWPVAGFTIRLMRLLLAKPRATMPVSSTPEAMSLYTDRIYDRRPTSRAARGTPTVAAVLTPVVRGSFHSAISSPSRGDNGPVSLPQYIVDGPNDF